MKRLGSNVFFLMMGLVNAAAQEQTAVERAAVQSFKVAPSFFVPNTASQKTGKRLVDDPEVSAFVQTQNGRVMFTPSGAVIGMSVPVEELTQDQTDALKRARDEGRLPEEVTMRSVVMKAGFSSAHAKNRQMAPRLEAQTANIVNYMVGPSADWRTEIPTYGKLVYDDVWEGITLEYLGFNDRLQFRLVLEPGSDPEQIVLETGGEQLELLEDGRLSVTLAGAELVLSAPEAFQDIDGVREAVPVTYKILDTKNLGFSLGAYAPDQQLLITPTLTWSSFVGGSANDSGREIAVDSSGNAYVIGAAISTNYPTTSGAYDQSHNGGADVIVTKFNNTGTALSYSTFFGGTFHEAGTGIAVDSSGNAYVTGNTQSSSFPTTSGAFDRTINGDRDVFVTKLNSSGTALSYSTFIGGGASDIGQSIALDSSGNVYVTGYTDSTNFPTTSGAYDESHNGSLDVFVSKLDSSGTALSYSTFIGDSQDDLAMAIIVDPQDNAYVAGNTFSTSYPTTTGAYDESHNGSSDVFVSKLNNSGTALSYSTLLGGSLNDYGRGIAVDPRGNAHVTGYSTSPTYPTTSGAYDESHNLGEDVVVSKLNNIGTGLSHSTFIGGSGNERGSGIAVDSIGNAYVTGQTQSTNYPTTSGAFDESFDGADDGFLSKIDNSEMALSYSTFLGGSDSDFCEGIAFRSGSAYITGYSGSPNYPTTSGAYDESQNGGNDVFLTKISFCNGQAQLPLWPDSQTILDIIACL